MREILFSVGFAALVASAVAFAPIGKGTPASSADPDEAAAERLAESIYGSIEPDSVETRAPASAPAAGVRVASLDVEFTASAAFAPERNSFTDRFNSSFGDRFVPREERAAAPAEGDREPAPASAQRASMPATSGLGRDITARSEPPKRQNPRVAMLTPAMPDKPTRNPFTESNRTAVYDITARVVYLPNGDKLEAHSGLGEHMDDPSTVAIKNKGVTPPNVYDLTLRERRFHGVQAIRMRPVDNDKMYGRDGILVHSYLLGPNGQSNGCISVKDYDKFLKAFLNGDIDRVVVVERLDDAPSSTAVGWISDRIKSFLKS